MNTQTIAGEDDRQKGADTGNVDGVEKTANPPELTEAQLLENAKQAAHRALDAAEKAWYAYAGLCDVGPERTRAFDVYENVRMARRV